MQNDLSLTNGLIGFALMLTVIIGGSLLYREWDNLMAYLSSKATSKGGLPWLVAAAFIAGIVVGSLVLPHPRYRVFNTSGVVLDSWTGELHRPGITP